MTFPEWIMAGLSDLPSQHTLSSIIDGAMIFLLRKEGTNDKKFICSWSNLSTVKNSS